MLHNTWTIFAEDIMVDKYTGRFVITNPIHCLIIDPTKAQQDPTDPEITWVETPKVTVISHWTRGPEMVPVVGSARLMLHAPHGKDFLIAEYPVDLTKESFLYQHGRLNRIQYEGPGLYSLSMEARAEGETEWRINSVLPFTVKTQEQVKLEMADREKEQSDEPDHLH